MDQAPAAAYLRETLRMYGYYRTLADRAIAQVADDADLSRSLDGESNSIAVIVKHVAGNLRSRFRDFLTSDGEKPDRHRDTEFEIDAPVSRAELLAWWNDAWSVALPAIEALVPEDLGRTVYIRQEAFLVVEALNRSITHTAYHVGQIVYLARHFAGPGWQSLSIPRGRSAEAVRGAFKQGAGL